MAYRDDTILAPSEPGQLKMRVCRHSSMLACDLRSERQRMSEKRRRGIVKEMLVRWTRVPLVLVAMGIAFVEVSRGPALLGNDLYRGAPMAFDDGWQLPQELHESWESESPSPLSMDESEPLFAESADPRDAAHIIEPLVAFQLGSSATFEH